DADRATRVGAERSRDEARGQRRPRAAARPARDTVGAPRVPGGTELGVDPGRPERELMKVSRPDDDRTRGAEASHDRGLAGRWRLALEHPATVGTGDAPDRH